MKNIALLSVLSALLLAGCGSSEPATTNPPADPGGTPPPPVAKSPDTGSGAATTIAYDLGSKKKGDKAHCAICVVNEGKGAEETVAETLDYKGKTYTFCNESEKAEFISNPAKYAAK